ncbi:hypothetical protein [Cyanobium sp. LEGE 06113]
MAWSSRAVPARADAAATACCQDSKPTTSCCQATASVVGSRRAVRMPLVP